MTYGSLPTWIRPMRRQDRVIVNQEQLWTILRSVEVCRVAFCHEGWPYIIPMNFGCLDGKLYFHCASSGTKLDLLQANPNVCFEVEANIEIVPGAEACNWSVRYESVIGFGRASIVEKAEEKRAAIQALLAQYTDQEIEVPEHVSPATVILRIDVDSLTGKKSTGE